MYKFLNHQNDPDWNLYTVKTLLDRYLEDLSNRKKQNITHTTRFFNK